MNAALNDRVLKALTRASADQRSEDIAVLLDAVAEMERHEKEPPYGDLLGHCSEFRVKRDILGIPKQINAVFKTSTRSNSGMSSSLKTVIEGFVGHARATWGKTAS